MSYINLHAIAKRLQLALCQRGCKVKINHVQFFSDTTGRPITMYVAVRTEKLKNGRINNTEIVSSSKMVDVVKVLASLLDSLQEEDGGE